MIASTMKRLLGPYWLWFVAPFVVVLLGLVLLLVLTESSALAPFVYFLF
jgi:hypothetical protein